MTPPTVKISVFYDEDVISDPDLNKMKQMLVSELVAIKGLETVELCADRANPPPEALSDYDLSVFCGYSLPLLSVLFSTLAAKTPVLIYDLPGDSIERELNSVLFSGVDAGRFPGSVLSQITHSWTYRDVIGICKQMVKNVSSEGVVADVAGARPVEDSGKTPPRKGTNPNATRSRGGRGRAVQSGDI